MILLDTSVVIEIIELGAGLGVCMENLQRFDPQDVHISTVTIFEFERGLFDGSPNIRARRARWKRFDSMVTHEPIFDNIASSAAAIVRQTAKKGHQLGAFDALIAATALEFGHTVATRDRDSSRVPGLKVELWR